MSSPSRRTERASSATSSRSKKQRPQPSESTGSATPNSNAVREEVPLDDYAVFLHQFWINEGLMIYAGHSPPPQANDGEGGHIVIQSRDGAHTYHISINCNHK